MADSLGSQSTQPAPSTIWPRRDPEYLVAILVLGVLVVWIFASQWDTFFQPRAVSANDLPQTAFTEETGVHITLVALSADGGIIDIRYQIVDPEKAIIVHDEALPPTILDIETGIPLLFTRHEHPDFDLHPGVTYSHQIINSGGLLKRGDRVALRFGTAVLEEVPIQ